MSRQAPPSVLGYVVGVLVTAVLVLAAYGIWEYLQAYADRTILTEFPLVTEVVAIFVLVSAAEWVTGRLRKS
jgi:ABC-type transport system involved in cytochrome c biogenesis permease subunit